MTTSKLLNFKFLGSLCVLAITCLGFATPTFSASVEEMTGQMILVGFRGDAAGNTRSLTKMIGEGRVGGVMYLRTNIKSLTAVKKMNRQFLNAGSPLPPFIALDQEGGKIERLTKAVGFNEIPSAAVIAQNTSTSQAEATYATMANSVSDLGFNLNFGPVVDLNINKKNPIIAKYERSFGENAADVTAYASAFVRAHRSANMLTALKHFPGHGSSTSDSHEGFVDITKTWQQEELTPYFKMISAGNVDMIMMGHLYHSEYADTGANKIPSSLSPNWVTGVLRNQLNYNGVVITDDLEMGAIRSHFSTKETVLSAVRAGVDVLLFSNTAKYRFALPDEVRAILVEEAGKDPAFLKRIEQSYERIRQLKRKL